MSHLMARGFHAVGVVLLLSLCSAALAASTAKTQAQPQTMASGLGPAEKLAAAATANIVFINAGKSEGLEIWRIEKFKPVPVKTSDYGKFYSGDSYLILKTKENRGGKKSWDIHYWLGKDSTSDESGAAAFYATHLDDKLGGSPVQHRETEGHETNTFQSYFSSGIRYLPGGVNSGWNHVNPNTPDEGKKLYQVKGKRYIRVSQVEPRASSMNKGDSYILDIGRLIFVYYGADSQRTERLKAVGAANQIRDQDHGGRPKVEIIDESSSPEDVANFFKELGGGSRTLLRDASAGGDDSQFEKKFDEKVTLYKVSDASGSLKVDKVGQKPLSKTALNTNDAFILDTGAGIYAWVGKKATKTEKDESMKRGQEFLKSKSYPSWTPITRVVEGGEPSTFKQYFTEWRDASEVAGLRGRRSVDSSSEEGDE